MPAEVQSAVPHYVGMCLFQNGFGLVLAFFLEKGELSFPKVTDLKGACLAAALYLIMLYVFMFRQALSKFVNVEIVQSQDKLVVEFFNHANRTFENALEQMPIFVSAFLCYTFLVNPSRGATIGFLYCLFLAIYPCLFGTGGGLAASTFPRYLMNHFMIWSILGAAYRTGSAPPAPAFAKGLGDVYSNSKYLADLQHGMDLTTCQHHCETWETTCQDLCKKEKACALTDDVDARHFTRETSCSKPCKGFNMHGDDHCTLFSDNVKLLKGGRGQFYNRAGFTPKGDGDQDD